MSGKRKMAGWVYTLGRVLFFCLSSAAILAITAGLSRGMSKQWAPIISLLATIAGVLILTLIFVRWEKVPLADVGVVPGKYSLLRIMLGFVIGFILACLQALVTLMTGHVKLIHSTGATHSFFILSLCLYLLVAVREEIAFRGYPLRSLNRVMPPWAALLITGIIFAAEHLLGGMSWRLALVGPGVGSLLFGLAALSTRGIALPIGLHFAWNFGQWLLGFKDETGVWQAVVEKGYESRVEDMGMMSYLLVMGLAIVAFYFYWKKASARATMSSFSHQRGS